MACRRCIGIHYIIITLVFAARQLHTETPRVHRRSEELDITLKEIQKRKKNLVIKNSIKTRCESAGREWHIIEIYCRHEFGVYEHFEWIKIRLFHMNQFWICSCSACSWAFDCECIDEEENIAWQPHGGI